MRLGFVLYLFFLGFSLAKPPCGLYLDPEREFIFQERLGDVPLGNYKRLPIDDIDSLEEMIQFLTQKSQNPELDLRNYIEIERLQSKVDGFSIDLIEKRLRIFNAIYENDKYRSLVIKDPFIPILFDSFLKQSSHLKKWGDLIDPNILTKFYKNLLDHEYDYLIKKRPDDHSIYTSPAISLVNQHEIFLNIFPKESSILDRFAPLLKHNRGVIKLGHKFNELPSSWQKVIKDFWLLDNISEVEVSGLRRASERENHILFGSCGTCHEMPLKHEQGLLKLSQGKKSSSTLIFFNGQFAGVLKFNGQKSFFALNNIRNERNEIIFMAGGTYKLPLEFIEQVSKSDTNRFDYIIGKTEEFLTYPLVTMSPTDINGFDEIYHGEDYKKYINNFRDLALKGIEKLTP